MRHGHGGNSSSPLKRVAAVASRMPWSNEDIARLSDLLGDGMPIKAAAKALGRSPTGIQGMARKIGLRVTRKGLTTELVICLRKDALRILGNEARARGMTPNALCRLALEITALDKRGWLETLLSEDASAQRNNELNPRLSDRLPMGYPPAAGLEAPEPVAVPTPALPFSIGLFSPMLAGSV